MRACPSHASARRRRYFDGAVREAHDKVVESIKVHDPLLFREEAVHLRERERGYGRARHRRSRVSDRARAWADSVDKEAGPGDGRWEMGRPQYC